MVSPEDAVLRRHGRYGGKRRRRWSNDHKQFAIHIDGADPPATTRDIVNGVLLGLSIGTLIAVAWYAF